MFSEYNELGSDKDVLKQALKKAKAGATWPVISKTLQATGVPKVQADMTAKEMVGLTPEIPQVQAGIGGSIFDYPIVWVGMGVLALGGIWLATSKR